MVEKATNLALSYFLGPFIDSFSKPTNRAKMNSIVFNFCCIYLLLGSINSSIYF